MRAAPKTLFDACEKYLEAKGATANATRVVEFDRERLEIVKRHLGNVKLSAITRETIEGFQAKRRLEGLSNRTVNMDVSALRQVLKRFKHWHRLEDDVKMLTESGGAPIGRVLSTEEQERLFEVARSNPDCRRHCDKAPNKPGRKSGTPRAPSPMRKASSIAKYGHLSQLATLDCTSSRRSTVMCALLRATAVTTVSA
jgi:hypothetical protein